jgi:hypothetical protein
VCSAAAVTIDPVLLLSVPGCPSSGKMGGASARGCGFSRGRPSHTNGPAHQGRGLCRGRGLWEGAWSRWGQGLGAELWCGLWEGWAFVEGRGPAEGVASGGGGASGPLFHPAWYSSQQGQQVALPCFSVL